MRKLYCYGAPDFKKTMDDNGWDNKTLPKSVACIEICATPDVLERYGNRFSLADKAWFVEKKSSGPIPENVLKLNFDDIDETTLDIGKGRVARGIDKDQAKRLVEFIDKNIGKDFYIHCHAGQSRSQAIVQFIKDFYPDHEWETRPENPCRNGRINMRVYSLLRMVKCGYETDAYLDLY